IDRTKARLVAALLALGAFDDAGLHLAVKSVALRWLACNLFPRVHPRSRLSRDLSKLTLQAQYHDSQRHGHVRLPSRWLAGLHLIIDAFTQERAVPPPSRPAAPEAR